MKKSLRSYISILLIMIMGISAAVLSACVQTAEDPEPEPEPPAPVLNPLTGASASEGYDETASDRRIAALVVENSPDARPQWGMDDPEYSPDWILQGEVEAGITRTLWMYADYNKLPEVIGPMRSARPPYIRFSELFDAIFIHWGQSSSKGDYVGANTVFKKDEVDHINQMTYEKADELFGRDYSRSTAIEHRGILYGSKVADAIADKGFRTEPEDFTEITFREEPGPVSDKFADEVNVRFSDKAAYEGMYWTYNADDKKYHTSNFRNDLTRDNLLVLYDDTEYIDKENYQGVWGHTVTYCDYKFSGGKALLFSEGTVREITWEVRDGKLVLIDPEATKIAQEEAEAAALAAEEAAREEEENKGFFEKLFSSKEEESETEEVEEPEPVEAYAAFNKGKTWVGWISANNGGNVDITAYDHSADQ